MVNITYRCTQYGECEKADNREPITIQPGEEPICPNPDCGKPLTRDASNEGGPISLPPPKLIVALVAVVVIGVATYFFWPHRSGPARAAGVEDSLADVWPWLKNSK